MRVGAPRVRPFPHVGAKRGSTNLEVRALRKHQRRVAIVLLLEADLTAHNLHALRTGRQTALSIGTRLELLAGMCTSGSSPPLRMSTVSPVSAALKPPRPRRILTFFFSPSPSVGASSSLESAMLTLFVVDAVSSSSLSEARPP